MEVLSEPANMSQRPITQNEDSDERREVKIKPLATKKKIIRKKNKSKAIHQEIVEHNKLPEVNTVNAMAPFGIFQSEAQKCQRLEHYFRKDIENFYKTEFQPYDYQVLDNLLNCNLIQLTDIYNKDLSDVWKQKICSLSEIRCYLQVVDLVKKHNANFTIIVDQTTKKYYVNLQKQNGDYCIHELSQLQAQLLQNRENFFQLLKTSEQKLLLKPLKTPELNGHHKMSQISAQIAFLFKSMYDSTRLLKNHVTILKQNINEIIKSEPVLEPATLPQSRYVTYLIKKLVLNALQDTQIDYLNFFKNNQLVQHNYGPPQATFIDQKQFQQFMRKKKNKKGKKGKYVLHTACLGCCSPYFEQYNPFSFCQQCYIRFHRSCYSGFPVRQDLIYINSRQEKDVLCETCYNKKITPNYKVRGNQCDYCGIKGLLSVPAGPSKRIHLFCMLLNGLWTVRNSKLQFKSKTQNKVPNSDSLKCLYCHSGSGYLHFCNFCQKYVHVSCAYFNGWKIDAQYDQFSENVELRLFCCAGVPLAQNEKRRKFVTNFRKQAYSF